MALALFTGYPTQARESMPVFSADDYDRMAKTINRAHHLMATCRLLPAEQFIPRIMRYIEDSGEDDRWEDQINFLAQMSDEAEAGCSWENIDACEVYEYQKISSMIKAQDALHRMGTTGDRLTGAQLAALNTPSHRADFFHLGTGYYQYLSLVQDDRLGLGLLGRVFPPLFQQWRTLTKIQDNLGIISEAIGTPVSVPAEEVRQWILQGNLPKPEIK
jgi:hypothetical protein